jgi:hypothetical protein
MFHYVNGFSKKKLLLILIVSYLRPIEFYFYEINKISKMDKFPDSVHPIGFVNAFVGLGKLPNK